MIRPLLAAAAILAVAAPSAAASAPASAGANAAALDEVLAPYLANARRIRTKAPAPRRPAAKPSAPAGPREVRAWAKHQGIAVSDRGRISADVMRQYQAAHGG